MTLRTHLSAVLVVSTLLGTASGQAPASTGAAPGPGTVAAPPAGELAPARLAAASPAEAAAADPAVRRLQEDLLGAVHAPGWGLTRLGVLVVSLERGDTLFSLNPDVPLAPASNMKLYSTAAALHYLGPAYRFSTYLLGTGPVRDGILEGDLVLYGTGDPAISGRMIGSSTAAFEAFADSLLAAGIRAVRGDLVGDGSYFDAEWRGPGWKDEYRLAWYSAPVGALSFAENVVNVRVLPGAGAGEPARISTTPATRGLALVNRVRTVTSGATSVRFEHGPGGIEVVGQIRTNHAGVSRALPVVDPVNYATAALHAVLEARGIGIGGGLRTVVEPSRSPATLFGAADAGRPAARVLAVHLSPTLAEIAEVTNHVSHNLFAEALLKAVGRVTLGEGTHAGGARAIRYLMECEVRESQLARFAPVDGSGLSVQNRVTVRHTIHLLDAMTRSPEWEPFFGSLPMAAAPRGLRRMQDTPAAGNLRAKTGTLIDVSALAGYVTSADGERLAFAIFANDVPATWRAKRMEDAIGASLASFRRGAATAGEE
jgi:serine-type D-Ala-D-Ala carboxypeptidase/endopeptidase (penicillin-binding protein 4)